MCTVTLSLSGHSESQELPLEAAAQLEDGVKEGDNAVMHGWIVVAKFSRTGSFFIANVSHERNMRGDRRRRQRQHTGDGELIWATAVHLLFGKCTADLIMLMLSLWLVYRSVYVSGCV